MTFDIKQRQEILAQYFALVKKSEEIGADDATSLELAQVTKQYEDNLPKVPMSRCPLSGEVIVHSFDPFGLDGLWWNCDAPVRPLFERYASCIAITGAVKFGGQVESVPFLCKPGPAVPYVYPKLLELDGIYGVISSMPVGAHTAYAILYFSLEIPDGVEMPNEWGTNRYWDANDGNPGWYENAINPQDWDFDIGGWIERGKLFWIAPFDATLTLKSDVATCPYIELQGTRQMQRIAYGKIEFDPDFPAQNEAPKLPEEILKGGFTLYELKPKLREKYNLPAIAIPIRAENKAQILQQNDGINILKLLEEIKACIALNPNLQNFYNPLIAALSYLAGMDKAANGEHQKALDLYAYGLEAEPENIGLRSHKALALECLGQVSQCKTELENLVADLPRGTILPIAWILLARIYADEGADQNALNLLSEVEKAAPNEAGLQELIASIKAKTEPKTAYAALVQPEPVKIAKASNSGIIAIGGIIIGLLLAAVIYLARDKLPLNLAQQAPTNTTTTTSTPTNETTAPVEAPKDDNSNQMSYDLIGIWAPKEYGCTGGYGAAYTPEGRYAEGDEYSREEGTWEIAQGKLQRHVKLLIETKDEASSPKAEPTERNDEFNIVSLSSDELTILFNGNNVSYVKCAEGHAVFQDGETYPK